MSDPEITPSAESAEEHLGTVHENLEGWIPAISTDDEIREALEKAFDYRGDLTITLKDGKKIEGYVFDRRIKGPALVRLLRPPDAQRSARQALRGL